MVWEGWQSGSESGGDLPSLHMQGKSTSGALEDLMLPVNTAAILVISSVWRLKYSC